MIIFDALGIRLLRTLQLKNLNNLYMNRNSQILTCSTFPHTQTSNIMIWSGQYRDYYWIFNTTKKWTDSARHERKPQWDGIKIIRYNDLNINNWIWKIIESNGYKSRAVSIPVVLPPVYYNSPYKTDKYFPYPEKDLYDNLRFKEDATMKSLEDMKNNEIDFYCTSFDQPDRLLHAIAEGYIDEEFLVKEMHYLDNVAKKIDEYCNKNDITYCIFGDHGLPNAEGEHFFYHLEQYIVSVRHRKHSIIISNHEGKLPEYTDEIYQWMLDYYKIKINKTIKEMFFKHDYNFHSTKAIQ